MKGMVLSACIRYNLCLCLYLERADEPEASDNCSAERSIRGAEKSRGPENTDGLLRLSCLQDSQRPPKLLHRPRQPRG